VDEAQWQPIKNYFSILHQPFARLARFTSEALAVL